MMQRISLRFAKQILVNSDAVKERFVSQGIPSGRVTIIPNGVDVARFSPGPPRAPRGNGLVVGAMSNLRPEKGLADLIRAVGIVRDLGLEVRLVIHGEGPLRKRPRGPGGETEPRAVGVASRLHRASPRLPCANWMSSSSRP